MPTIWLALKGQRVKGPMLHPGRQRLPPFGGSWAGALWPCGPVALWPCGPVAVRGVEAHVSRSKFRTDRFSTRSPSSALLPFLFWERVPLLK